VYSLTERAPDVEQLLRDLMARAKAGDADGVGELFAPGAATLLVGSEPGDWYPGSEVAVVHLRESLEKYGAVPFEPDAPVAWSEGAVAWFADRPTIVFPQVSLPIRITGVAIGGGAGWRIVQIHFSAGVPDEPLLNG
jgi:SnoaL-like protein